MAELNKRHINLILNQLKNIQNVATIMDMYFKPFDEFKEEKKYTIDETINAKESQQKYLNKYGAFTLRTTIRNIEDILNGTDEYSQQFD